MARVSRHYFILSNQVGSLSSRKYLKNTCVFFKAYTIKKLCSLPITLFTMKALNRDNNGFWLTKTNLKIKFYLLVVAGNHGFYRQHDFVNY